MPLGVPAKGNPRLESSLDQLATAHRARDYDRAVEFAIELGLVSDGGAVRIVLEAEDVHAGTVAHAAKDLGCVIEDSYENLVQVLAPISSLEQLADAPGVKFVRLPLKAISAIVSQGVSLINANAWQSSGFNGAGVKIAVLDLGFANYTSRLGSELPGTVTARSFRADGNISAGTNHGTAVAEVVYDIAPGAQLYLVNFATEVEMANAVDYLINQGVHIVCSSVVFVNTGAGDGSGFVNYVVNHARSGGVLWVQAAGNLAQHHWAGAFADPDVNNWHNFSGADENNRITVSAGMTIEVALSWDDPWGASSNDYDLYVYSGTETTPCAYSINTQAFTGIPIENIRHVVTSTGTYRIKIRKYMATRAVNFRLFALTQDLEYRSSSGSLPQPADSASAMAVGAVLWSNPTAIEPYSSRGPTTDGRIKPDLVAPDGISTASIGVFSGTSAAAAHATGAAALVKQAYPISTPAEIQGFLEGRAIDLAPSGKDNTFGAGRLNLGAPPAPPSVSFTAVPISGTIPLTVSFAATYSGYITSRTWSFGDGNTSTNPNPSHTYTAPGTYTVTLAVSNPITSHIVSRTSYIRVYQPVAASFTATPTLGTVPLAVTFSDASTGDIASRLWAFGDGIGTSTAQNPVYTYNTAGVYTVSLWVNGRGGDSNTKTEASYIRVYQPVAASFTATPTVGTVPLVITFSDASTGDIASRLWAFGDGHLSNLRDPIHTYNTTGTFTVSLTVRGLGGDYNANTKTRLGYITAYEPIVPALLPAPSLASSH